MNQSPDQPTEQLSVLIVDDNYSLLEILQDLLSKWGYKVTIATSGQDAKSLLSKYQYNVLLADLRMSPVSGWEVIRQAKEIEGTEVIVMTGYASLDSSLEAFHQRVFDFLEKPLDFDRLNRSLRNAANQSVLSRQSQALLEKSQATIQQLQSELDSIRSQVSTYAIHDELTGVYNQRWMMETLENEVSRSRRYRHPLSVTLLTVDYPQYILSEFGKKAGEEVLVRTAKILKDNLRKCDLVCRLNEWDFGIIFPVTSKLQAQTILKRLATLIRMERFPDWHTLSVSISAVIGGCPQDAETSENLIQVIRQTLTQLVSQGKDRVVLVSPPSLH